MSDAGSWRTVVGIGLIWPTILGLGILTMPESPRWLAKKGRIEEARISIARSRGIPLEEAESNKMIHREIEDMQSALEYEREVQASFWTFYRYLTLIIRMPLPFSHLTIHSRPSSPPMYLALFVSRLLMVSTMCHCGFI